MLSITFREPAKYMRDSDKFFNRQNTPKWFDDFAKEAILDIDKSHVLSPYCIESPMFGQIAPTMLSSGVRTVIAMRQRDDYIMNGSKCGDNCAKWLIRACEDRDRLIYLQHIMRFEDCPEPIILRFADTDRIVHNRKEYLDEMCNLIFDGKAP